MNCYPLVYPLRELSPFLITKKKLLKEFRSAFKNYDVIVVTGGLGPTHDDITVKCVAKFFKSKYVLDEKVLKHVKSIFARRNITMPAVNIGQALVPEKRKYWKIKPEPLRVC